MENIITEIIKKAEEFSIDLKKEINHINDIKDIELDKLHPIKKNSKPLAANKIKVQSAFIIIIFLLLFLFCFLVLSNIILIHIITYFILYISKIL